MALNFDSLAAFRTILGRPFVYPVYAVRLQPWCIVTKRLDGLGCHLVRR